MRKQKNLKKIFFLEWSFFYNEMLISLFFFVDVKSYT